MYGHIPCITVLLDSSVHITEDSVQMDRKLRTIHDDLKVVKVLPWTYVEKHCYKNQKVD